MLTKLLSLVLTVVGLVAVGTAAIAQTTSPPQWQSSQWQRNSATLDLNFATDQYYVKGSSCAPCTGVSNFVTISSSTFTRASTVNVTANTNPFYLDSTQGQGFVSRATVTNNVTPVSAPFFIGTTGNSLSQAWVSRADTSATATYFNASGTLQTAASGVARTNAYYYSGSSWLLGGTLIEPAATNSVRNNTMAGAAAATAITPQTVTAMSRVTTTVTVTTSAASGLAVGNVVTITGAVPAAYNGTFTVASVTTVSPYKFTYVDSVNPGANTTLGSYTATTQGTLPTNWTWSGTTTGITTSIVATGTVNGVSYVDLRLAGTATALTTPYIAFDSNSAIAGIVGQTWTNSLFLNLVGGSATGIGVNNVGAMSYNSSGTLLATTSFGSPTIPTTLLRSAFSGSLPALSTAFAVPYFATTIASGTSVDATIRIGMPQFELNPSSSATTGFATSVIATSTAAVTRAPDIYSQQPASYFDGTGTLYFSPFNVARDNHSPSSPYTDLGTLIEPNATNSLRNSAMAGVFLADTIERTLSGTFSGCSGATCTGWTTNLNGGTGSVSYAGNTATIMGDGTNNATIYQAIPTVSGALYIVTLTTGAGTAGTFKVGTLSGNANLYPPTAVPVSATSTYEFIASSATSYIQINNISTTAMTVTAVSTQSAGSPPTNWGVNSSDANVLTRVVGTGVENGIPYVDIQYNGTTSTVANLGTSFETTNSIASAINQNWTVSGFFKLVAGSWGTPIQGPKLNIGEYASGNILTFGGTNLTPLPTSGGLATQYYSYPYLTTSATATDVDPYLIVQYAAGTAVNFTVRIGIPQMEQSSFPTSSIPTFGSIVTRSADIFVQPAGGTYYKSNGALNLAPTNTPRLDHNPVTFAPVGLLIEEARANTNLYSENTAQTIQYTPSNVTTTTGAATSPSGINNASVVTETATSSAHTLALSVPSNFTTSTAYTASTFVQANGRSNVTLWVTGALNSTGSTLGVNYNLATGATGSIIGTPTSYGIIPLSNNWYRCFLTFTTASSVSSGNVSLSLTTGDTTTANPSYAGDGASGVFLWGTQFEAGPQPTSYIPTGGSTVTRPQETFFTPGTAGSGWLTNNVGTFSTVGSIAYQGASAQAFAGLDNGTSAQSIYTYVSPTLKRAVLSYSSGNLYSATVAASYTLGNTTKIAAAFASADDQGVADGTLMTAGTSALPATQSRLTIGHGRATIADLDGWLQRVWYMPTRQPNTALPADTQ